MGMGNCRGTRLESNEPEKVEPSTGQLYDAWVKLRIGQTGRLSKKFKQVAIARHLVLTVDERTGPRNKFGSQIFCFWEFFSFYASFILHSLFFGRPHLIIGVL
jgi:hypothetical protein